MRFIQNLMFLGLSEARYSKGGAVIPIAEQGTECGIYVIDLDDMEVVAKLRFTGDIKQIYDVAVLDLPFADLLQIDEPIVRRIYDFPTA